MFGFSLSERANFEAFLWSFSSSTNPEIVRSAFLKFLIFLKFYLGACGNGHVIFAHVIEKRIEWKEFEATVNGRKSISVRNVTNEAWEKLEFRDRIIHISLANNHLVVGKYYYVFKEYTQ